MLESIEELERAARSEDSDEFGRGIGRAWQEAQRADPGQLHAALAALAALVDRLPSGPAAELATLAGALVEIGAPDAAPLAGPVFRQYRTVLAGFVQFASAWRAHTGEPVPATGDRPLDEVARRLGGQVGDPALAPLLRGWYFLDSWNRPVLTLLCRPEVRAAVPDRERLIALLTEAGPDSAELHWITGLLAIVDDDPLVVLHRETGRGFLLRADGVADNFQLHTLLAAALVSPGLVPGRAPEPAWVAAASDAPPDTWSGTVTGSFNLVDADGQWIWNEGRPADIPVRDGRRLIVLDPPPYQRTWSCVRRYPDVPGRLRLEGQLSAEQAAGWFALLPAGEAARG